jgi:hypothetical protein
MTHRPARRQLLAGCLATALVSVSFLAGCDSESTPATTTTVSPAETTTQVTTQTTPPKPTSAPFPIRTYDWEAESPDGSEAKLTVNVGELSRADDLPVAFQGLASACTLDAARDAVMPLQVEATNLTADFAVDLDVRIGARFPLSVDRRVLGAGTQFAEGQQCDDMNQDGTRELTSVIFSDAPTGEAQTHNFVLVLRRYYSPNSPGGDTALADSIALGFGLNLGDVGITTTTTCFSGPEDSTLSPGVSFGNGSVLIGGFPMGMAQENLEETQRDELPECGE